MADDLPTFWDALPGIVMCVIMRGPEIFDCLRSKCDSHILKVEKVLMHLSFSLGFSSPSRLIHLIVMRQLKKTFVALDPWLKQHPYFEQGIPMGLQMVEQYGLSNLWDHIRDSCICLRFDNCESNDFLIALNNIKISRCDVDPFNETREISVCEKLFIDSPLIMLSFVMLVLTLISVTEFSPTPPQNHNPNNNG